MSWGTPVSGGGLFDTANGPTVTLTNVAFTTGRLYVAFYTGEGTGGLYDHSTMAITGQTGSWAFLAQTTNGVGANARRISAWTYLATATETVNVVFDPPGGNKACNAAIIIEVPSGFDTTTPVAQVTENEDNTGSASFATNLASAPASGNLSIVGVMRRNVTTGNITPDAGFTELAEVTGSGTSTDSGSLEVQYKDPATQNCSSGSSSGTPVWGGLHVELAAATASGDLGTASGTVAFTTAAVLTTAISLVASATVAFTTAAVLTTGISLAASSTVALTTAAAITTAIQMAAAATVAFTTSAALSTAIQLAANATIAFTSAADLTAGVTGDLGAASATVVFTAVAVLSSAIHLNAVASVAFSSAAALTTAISLAATATLALETTGALSTAIQFGATATVAFTTVAALSAGAGGDLGAASATLSFTTAAVLTTALTLVATARMAFSCVAALTAGPGTLSSPLQRHIGESAFDTDHWWERPMGTSDEREGPYS